MNRRQITRHQHIKTYKQKHRPNKGYKFFRKQYHLSTIFFIDKDRDHFLTHCQQQPNKRRADYRNDTASEFEECFNPFDVSRPEILRNHDGDGVRNRKEHHKAEQHQVVNHRYCCHTVYTCALDQHPIKNKRNNAPRRFINKFRDTVIGSLKNFPPIVLPKNKLQSSFGPIKITHQHEHGDSLRETCCESGPREPPTIDNDKQIIE